MFHVYNALFETAFGFGREYGRPVALAVVVLLGGGIALWVVSRLLRHRGPKGG
jgi:hypothetical protein